MGEIRQFERPILYRGYIIDISQPSSNSYEYKISTKLEIGIHGHASTHQAALLRAREAVDRLLATPPLEVLR